LLHSGPWHIGFNMLALFFIGPDCERSLGTYRFSIMYVLTGILGGVGWLLISESTQYCIGASGAVYGVLGCFAALYPNRKLLVFLIIPVKALTFVIILAAVSFLSLGGQGGVAHSAHLAGGLAGYFYARRVRNRPRLAFLGGKAGRFQDRVNDFFRGFKSKVGRKPEWDMRPDPTEEEVDRVLDKISEKGFYSLTQDERDILTRARKPR